MLNKQNNDVITCRSGGPSSASPHIKGHWKHCPPYKLTAGTHRMMMLYTQNNDVIQAECWSYTCRSSCLLAADKNRRLTLQYAHLEIYSQPLHQLCNTESNGNRTYRQLVQTYCCNKQPLMSTTYVFIHTGMLTALATVARATGITECWKNQNHNKIIKSSRTQSPQPCIHINTVSHIIYE